LEIKSDSVRLGDHVGHTVKITGVVSNAAMHGVKEDAKDTARGTAWVRTPPSMVT